MRSAWAGISSLFSISQRIAYRKIPPRKQIAGRKSCRRGLGTKSVYGKKSGSRGAANRIRGLFYKDCFGETPKPTRENACATRNRKGRSITATNCDCTPQAFGDTL